MEMSGYFSVRQKPTVVYSTDRYFLNSITIRVHVVLILILRLYKLDFAKIHPSRRFRKQSFAYFIRFNKHYKEMTSKLRITRKLFRHSGIVLDTPYEYNSPSKISRKNHTN